jgi:hypothetical protein
MPDTTQQSLFRFDRDLQAFSRQMGIDVITVQKKIGFDLFRRIVSRTPVDTGRARASWNISLDHPDRTVAPEMAHPSMQTGDAPSPPAGAARAGEAGGALASLKPGQFRPIWITNNLPYIERLEHGHSQQAPAGMVALSILETELELDTAIRVSQR